MPRVAKTTEPGCACGTHAAGTTGGMTGGGGGPGKKAGGVDRGAKARNLARLRGIEGEGGGLHKMVEEDRYCADILGQVSAAQEALRAVGRELMRNHLKHCATKAIRAGDPEAEAMYDELVALMYRNAR
jgi:CsoR family transcriptional regulator, copper-sensing transcriptional repressor